jgi:CheY-like chemotaxis protein
MQRGADIVPAFFKGFRCRPFLCFCQRHDGRRDFNGVKIARFSRPLSFPMKDVPDLHSASILIIDDCRDTASLLCELMTLNGYENVSWVTDGGALTCLHPANNHKLILLDMHMPAVSGLDVIHYLRGTKHASCVPVIAISGDQRYKLAALEAGACAFLLKPFDYDELEATVSNALATRYESGTSLRPACEDSPRDRMTKDAGRSVFSSSLPPPPPRVASRQYARIAC